MKPSQTTNRLAAETSPYLLQHARNPVDWYPWGPEAFERALAEDKPILLSVGYAACHWCHVMERESFEHDETARLMNERFVCVKVDREERPDVDQVYQTAVQVLGGHGGWPLTVFLAPDLRPFFGGTYYPREPGHGRPAFTQVLRGVSEAFHERRSQVASSADQIEAVLREIDASEAGRDADALDPTLLARACDTLLGRWDDEHHGFGRRPKFPNSLLLEAFLRRGGPFADRARAAFLAMSDGGLLDQLGGGFHRYSTDESWLVPHFEKMLYDNALLLRLGAQLLQLGADPRVERVVRETAAWGLREMQDEAGGFHATQDADSEGEEGRFFAFAPDEVAQVLGADAEPFCRAFGIVEGGNFEHGRSVLHRRLPERCDALDDPRRRLFEAREHRVKPAKDDKVIAGWNGLWIQGLAAAGAVLDEPRFVGAAVRASDFVWTALQADGKLLRTWRHGVARHAACAEDHAFLAEGELELFEATGATGHLERARSYVDRARAAFEEPEGGFLQSGEHSGPLPIRPRSTHDNAVPSATSSLAHALLRLGAITGEGRYVAAAERALLRQQASMARNPFAHGWMLCAHDLAVHGPETLVITGKAGDPAREALLAAARRSFHPHVVIVPWTGSEPLAEGVRSLVEAKRDTPAAHLCRSGTCLLPVERPEELASLLAR